MLLSFGQTRLHRFDNRTKIFLSFGGVFLNQAHVQQIPLIGDRFPEIKVNTTLGSLTLPNDYNGKWFVLFSHPGDFTPVCTTEFVAFEKRRKEFKELNTELIGLSLDRVYSHLKWIEWIKENLRVSIKFPVIEDTLGRVSSKLGMLQPKYSSSTVRAVFIVDDKGIIRMILYYPQEVGRNIDEIIRAVTALQTADKYEAATPANWPHNELIGNKLILPPAGNIKMIADRIAENKAGSIQCFDWWFCYKD